MPKKKETEQATKEEKQLHHENDKIFKIAMKHKETALEYVEKFLKDVHKYLDLDYFELDTTNYVGTDFDEFFSDVVYRTQLKTVDETEKPNKSSRLKHNKPVAIVLLFEHKKSIKSSFLLFLQLLEYIIQIWKNDVLNKRKPSVIIPIVVYQGAESFKIRQLHQSFRGVQKELLKYIPNFECHFTEIQNLENKDVLALNEEGLLRSLFLAYKYVEKNNQIENFLIEIFKFFNHDPSKFDFFRQIFEYLSKKEYLSPEEVEKLFAQYLKTEEKEMVLTTYEVWMQKGEQIGRQEGEQIGETNKARLVVLRGKWRGRNVADLADISELPLDVVSQLMQGYEVTHESWQKKKKPRANDYLSKEEVDYLYKLFEEKGN